MQRVPTATPLIDPAQEPGGDTSSLAEETAGIVAEATRRANVRRLLPAEIEEVSALWFLAAPQGPGVVVGPGTRKLLAGVERLGARRVGSVVAYKRDPETEEGLPSWIAGDRADPDFRISVTADGLLEVTKATRTQPRATKGQPPPPPKVTPEPTVFDLQSKKVELKTDETVAGRFLRDARRAVERERQERVLKALGESGIRVSDGETESDNMTLGGFVREVTSGVYTQVSYHDQRQSELLKKVLSAFTSLRTEFEAYKASLAVPLALGGGRPTHEQFARMFAAKLQPAIFSAAALAQSELDQATAALTTATAEASSAADALKALKTRKGVPKPEKDAATARKSAADRSVKAVAATVKQRKGALKLSSAQRETFYRTIAWILDRTAEREKRAAMSVGGLCNVITFFLYGKAVGVIPPETDFQDYYLAEVKAARIRYHKGDEHEGVLWGEGSELWAEQRDLERYEDPDLKLDRRARADPMTHESRRAELDAFLKSGANVALTHQDLKEPASGKPHHFLFIVKVDGVWRNIDHTSSSFLRRGSITDWNRVYRIEVDASLMRAVQLPPAPSARPAGGMPLE